MMSASHRVLHYQLCPVSKPRLSSHPSLPPSSLSLSLFAALVPIAPSPSATAYELILLCAECKWVLRPSDAVCARLFDAAVDARDFEFAFAMLPALVGDAQSSTRAPARRERGATVGITRALTSLFNACASEATQPGGRPDRLISAFAHLIHSGYGGPPTTSMYLALLDACGEADLLSLLAEANAFPSDGASADAMLAACVERKAFTCAHDLLALLADYKVEAAVEAKTSAASEAVTNATDVTEETEPMGGAPNQSAGRRGRATRDSSRVWLPDPSLVDSLLRSAERLVSTHEGLRLALHRLGAPLPSGMSPVSVVSPKFAPWPKPCLPPVVREEVAPGVAAEEKDGVETPAAAAEEATAEEAGAAGAAEVAEVALADSLGEDTGAAGESVEVHLEAPLERCGSPPLNPTPRKRAEHDSGGGDDHDDDEWHRLLSGMRRLSAASTASSGRRESTEAGSDTTSPSAASGDGEADRGYTSTNEVTAAAIRLTPNAAGAELIASVIGVPPPTTPPPSSPPTSPPEAPTDEPPEALEEEEEGPEFWRLPSGLWWSEA